MTVLTPRRLGEGEWIGGMQRWPDVGVTLRAEIGGGNLEARIAMAIAAREILIRDVDGVTRARPDRLPDARHLLRRALISGGARAANAERDAEGDDDDEPHRTAPGWQSRHGIAPSGNRLDQPAGWGFPPTPPTA